VLTGGSLLSQQVYQPRYSDPLDDVWRWERLDELGSHNRRIVVNDSGQALILKKAGDDRVMLFDGLTQTFLQHPSMVGDLPIRVWFGANDEILMLGEAGVYKYENDAWNLLLKHSLQINPNSEVVSGSDGRYWICGNNGIIEFSGSTLTEHHFDEIPASDVHGLCLGNDGALWMVVGPTGDVFRCPIINGSLVSESNWELVYKSEREFVHQSWILATRENQIWVVNNHEHDGALIYDIASKSWESHNLRTLGGTNFSTSLMQSHDGRVWVIGRGSLHLSMVAVGKSLKDRSIRFRMAGPTLLRMLKVMFM
jgi:hypothetical protein